MEKLIAKYAGKLVSQGLCEEGAPLIGGLDAKLIWNRQAPEAIVLEQVIRGLNINSILYAQPAEPYASILSYLAEHADTLTPEDSETRTFLHDIPVTRNFDAGSITAILKNRKCVIVPGPAIVSFGMVSPEQAFVTFSSVCFAGFVKFFADLYFMKKKGIHIGRASSIAESALVSYGSFMDALGSGPGSRGPFRAADEIVAAIAEAGRITVHSRMVDSFFGNISYRGSGIIYISQTGSSLDELEGHIDPCPIDGSTTVAITASSEYSAHKSVYMRTGYNAILHGHPKFCVIMSMLCDDLDCSNRGLCYKKCSRGRFIEDVPIIPGEVGTGPTGISTTLPPALTGRGAIVWGHGLFTTGMIDYTDAYRHLVDIERSCFEKYRGLIS